MASFYGYDIATICRNTAAVVGAAYIVRALLREIQTLANGVLTYFLAPRGIGRTKLLYYGSWAVVTGASDGIGRGYALELARQGLNVVLISRSEKKLQKVADEIRVKHGVEVATVVADFTAGQEVFPRIEDSLVGLDIGVLVNNVGLSYVHPEYFLTVTKERHRQIIEINCQTMVQMTHMILPKMLEKKKGIVVNVSSISDAAPCKLLVTYGASKRFVRHFTDSLRYECGSQGIVFQTVASGMVTTAMSNARKVTFFTPDPVTYARAAVATIGLQNYTHGYWTHALQQYLMGLMTRSQQASVSGRYLVHSRKVLLRRKSEGTLVSQLQQKIE